MFNLANKLLNKCNHSCLGSKCTLKKYLPYKCSVSSIIAKEIKLILKYLESSYITKCPLCYSEQEIISENSAFIEGRIYPKQGTPLQ